MEIISHENLDKGQCSMRTAWAEISNYPSTDNRGRRDYVKRSSQVVCNKTSQKKKQLVKMET